jgi:hypothetical protein
MTLRALKLHLHSIKLQKSLFYVHDDVTIRKISGFVFFDHSHP